MRCASVGLNRVCEALADRMTLLGGSRDTDHRHRSLRATLDWSVELLSEPDRRLLYPLGAFSGWFGPDDAAAVADPGDKAVTPRPRAAGGQEPPDAPGQPRRHLVSALRDGAVLPHRPPESLRRAGDGPQPTSRLGR